MGRILELLFIGVIVFFAWKGSVAVDYFMSPSWNETLSNGGGLRSFLYWLFGIMPGLMLAATVGLIIVALIPDRYQPKTGGALLVSAIAWGIMGWWQAGQFADGDPKLVAHILYSIAALLTVIFAGKQLIIAFNVYKSPPPPIP